MQVLCLDMEGVLVPEIWIEFAKRTGIPEFSRTTRDEPDYDKLMRYRIDLLARHKLRLADIQQVIDGMGPLAGARDFLDDMRTRFQVIILSDTFYEFADPLMRQLGRPTLFCHRLLVDADGFFDRVEGVYYGVMRSCGRVARGHYKLTGYGRQVAPLPVLRVPSEKVSGHVGL